MRWSERVYILIAAAAVGHLVGHCIGRFGYEFFVEMGEYDLTSSFVGFFIGGTVGAIVGAAIAVGYLMMHASTAEPPPSSGYVEP